MPPFRHVKELGKGERIAAFPKDQALPGKAAKEEPDERVNRRVDLLGIKTTTPLIDQPRRQKYGLQNVFLIPGGRLQPFNPATSKNPLENQQLSAENGQRKSEEVASLAAKFGHSLREERRRTYELRKIHTKITRSNLQCPIDRKGL
jgi:hypothetical protein